MGRTYYCLEPESYMGVPECEWLCAAVHWVRTRGAIPTPRLHDAREVAQRVLRHWDRGGRRPAADLSPGERAHAERWVGLLMAAAGVGVGVGPVMDGGAVQWDGGSALIVRCDG